MSLIYADTSALLAYLHPTDEFSDVVDAAVKKHAPDFVYWPWLRLELRHNLRLLRGDYDGETAWKALSAAEKTSSRLRWQSDLDAGRMIDSADELSAQHAGEISCGSGDFLHVAAARRLQLVSGLDEFWTCDTAQAALAKKSGLTVRLFELKHPSGE